MKWQCVESVLPIELNDKEKAALKESTDTLKAVIKDVSEERKRKFPDATSHKETNRKTR